MPHDLLIGAGPGEWRAAWVEAGAVVELHIERGDAAPAGSIHLGRVVRRSPGLDAVLVDIGQDRPGFLPLGHTTDQRLDDGARVIVQVRREAQQDKGARLSTRLATRSGDDPAELTGQAARLEPPAQIDPPPGFAGALALRLPARPKHILADEPAIIRELRDAFPEAAIAHRLAADWPLDLDAAFAAALAPSLALPGGGRIHIAETRAAVLIDVDTGTPDVASADRAALAANLAAAQTIARQLRLRQLGGGIVIDFVGLEGRGARDRLRQEMAAALAGDPAQPQVLGWTRLGHLEIVRPRRGRPLSEAMLQPGSIGKSSAALAFEALRLLQREARARPAANWRLVVAPAVEVALRGPAAAGLRALETRLARDIAIAVEPGRDPAAFDIAPR